jgi:hypothetical protein
MVSLLIAAGVIDIDTSQAEGTAPPSITLELIETMRTQSGPYRASETLDTADILHIGGVLYAGESVDGCGFHRLTGDIAASDTVRVKLLPVVLY